MKKPKWVVEKNKRKGRQLRKRCGFWFACGARCAVKSNRQHLRLILTKNAADKLGDAVQQSRVAPEICDPRKFAPR